MLELIPAPALNRVASKLLDLPETSGSTKEDRRDLVHFMILEFGVEVPIKRVFGVKTRSEYELLFSVLDWIHQDLDRRFWIERLETQRGNSIILEENTGHMSIGVEIVQQASQNILIRTESYVKLGYCNLRVSSLSWN